MPVEGFQQQRFNSVLPGERLFPDLGRDHPLGQIVDPLEVVALADSEFSTGPQGRGDTLCQLEIPPAVATATFHVEGAKRALLPNLPTEILGDFWMSAHQIPPPGVVLELPASEFEGRVEVDRKPAGFMSPILKEVGPRVQKTLAKPVIEAFQSG